FGKMVCEHGVCVCVFNTCAGGTAEPVYGLIRKEAELKPKVTETIHSITWKKQKDKIAEWDGSDKPEYYGRCSKDQCDLSPTTGVLVMKGLKREDEWTYSAEINGKTSQEEFLVTVLAPVSKPTVTASCNETRCTLTCVGLETKSATYSWKENSDTVKDVEGNTLMVEKSGDLHKRYSCVFSNPKSGKESDPLTEMDLFLGESSSFSFVTSSLYD
uniref:Ig-like domain-containing protein n=1 Tax=Scleropages formosus TaxID=113540 RepID=A0A8C9UXC7_SCLFO